jgi:phosphoadenosine phosphosulfate reductase
VSSFGAESAVLLHMAAQVDPAIPVIFLETGLLFGQTLDHRKRLAERLGLTDVRDIRPDAADLATHDPTGLLHRTDVDACCHIRKVLPLDRALGGFDAWITGRKRFQGGERLSLRAVETDTDGEDQGQPARQLDQGRHRRLRRRAQPPRPPAGGPGLSLDRLLALHPPGRRGPGRPRRPLGGAGKDRVRHPCHRLWRARPRG